MASQVFNALANGYTSQQVLGYLIRRYPQHAQAISVAQQASYPAHLILKHLTDPKNQYDEDQFLTHEERTKRNIRKTNEQANLQAIGALGTLGAAAAGAYYISQTGQAIRPNQILPAQGPRPRGGAGGQPTINVQPQGPRPRGGGGGGLQQPNQPLGLPYKPQKTQQQQQQSPSPKQFIPKPMVPEQNFNLIKNIQEDIRVENILKQGFPIATAASILRTVIPKSKVALLDKTEGGLEKVIADYAEYLQNQPPSTQQQQQQSPQMQQQQAFQMSQKEMNQPENIPRPFEQMQEQQQSQQQKQFELKQDPMPLNERIQQAAFAERPELKTLVDSSYQGKEFFIPNYKYPGETSEDYENRKLIFDAVNKAAKAITEGKSFLDFPVSKEALKGIGGYSTASDVLRFMAGIPNVYDELLDPEEKQELFDALGPDQLSVESLRPTEGQTAIHGAPMTPNLIWNLLLSIEPKLSNIKRPPAIKGAPIKGAKMDTTGFRRFLTHGVYGVLSGKSVPPDLSDKIQKISHATNSIDAIVKAAKDGNFRKVQKEIDDLYNNDNALFSLISNEIDRYEESRIPPEKRTVSFKSQDTKYANQLKKIREQKNIETEPI